METEREQTFLTLQTLITNPKLKCEIQIKYSMRTHVVECGLHTSHLDSENVCPKCRRPFMYGNGNVTKYFSSSLVRPSAGASNSNAFSCSHFACTSRSIFCKNSTLKVPFRSSPACHRNDIIQQRQQKK